MPQHRHVADVSATTLVMNTYFLKNTPGQKSSHRHPENLPAVMAADIHAVTRTAAQHAAVWAWRSDALHGNGPATKHIQSRPLATVFALMLSLTVLRTNTDLGTSVCCCCCSTSLGSESCTSISYSLGRRCAVSPSAWGNPLPPRLLSWLAYLYTVYAKNRRNISSCKP